MNAPMTGTLEKTIYGKRNGFDIPVKIKRFLIGAKVLWEDQVPLSQDITDELHFFFDSKTTPMVDLLLKKHGLVDVSQYVNIPFHWGVEMELYYRMPNRAEGEKQHIDKHYFEYHGTIFPLHEKFRKERDTFYLLKNLSYLEIPEDHKNKKIYETTRFRAAVIGT